MPFADWKESYEIGVDRVDDQHRRLFELVNDLYESMRGEQDLDTGTVLSELEEYTRKHFGDEQEFMGECGFSSDCADCYQAHQTAHETFAATVSDLQELYEAGDATVEMKTLRFLRSWLSEHVGEVDQQLKTFLEDGPEDLEPMEMDTEIPT